MARHPPETHYAQSSGAKIAYQVSGTGPPDLVMVHGLVSNLNGLARTRLAESEHDAGWSAFVHMLEYKARRYGREFHRIGRFEPTSRVCSACG